MQPTMSQCFRVQSMMLALLLTSALAPRTLFAQESTQTKSTIVPETVCVPSHGSEVHHLIRPEGVDWSQTLYKLTLEANDRKALITARWAFEADVRSAAPVAKPDARPLPSAVASSVPAARQTFLFWSFPGGKLTLTRDDLIPTDVNVSITIEPTDVERVRADALTEGFNALLTISGDEYNRLLRYARCVRDRTSVATKCLADQVKKDEKASPSTETFQSDKDRTTDRLFSLVSGWIGRDPAGEYAGTRASRSEPLVLFIGVGGSNQIILLHCQGTVNERDRRRCDDYAKPSALTLERADYFWATYVEDEQTPYETTIEVEFSRSERSRDYDEYDPRVGSEGMRPASDSRVIRIGWRRFHMREAPNTVQVAFTRQGPGYGLRQWVRVFEQRSKWPVVPAAALFLPSVPATRQTTTLEPLHHDDGLGPTGFEVRSTDSKRFVFAMLALEWPQLRSKARDVDLGRRILYNLTPDIALGFADSSTYFTGGSWPVPLWPEHSSITVGTVWQHVTRPRLGFNVGDRVPVGTRPSDVIEERWLPWPPNGDFMHSIRVGLSIDLLKTPR